jgi:hypothetical protein
MNLLKRLADKGKFMGFDIEIGEGSLTWFFREGEPIVTFLMEPEDSFKLVEESMNLFWTPDTNINKPWCLICILTGGKFEPSHRDTFQSLSSEFRVGLFDIDNISLLDEFIDEQVSILIQILGRYSPYRTLNSLCQSIKRWKEGDQSTLIRFKANVISNESYLAILKTGHNLIRSTPPMTIEDSNGIIYEGILPRLMEEKNDVYFFSTEHRNLPFKLSFTIEGNESSIELCFEPDKGNVLQAITFEQVLEAIKVDRGFKLKDLDGGTLFNFHDVVICS